MLQLMPWFTLLAAVTLAACAFPVQAAETVTITSSLASKGPFTAQLLRPSGAGPFPVVVALHGCGGLLNSRGQLRSREADWADRFLAAGYAVLFPDSFTARGMREICTERRAIHLSQGSRRRCAGGRGVAGRAALRRQAQAGPDRLVARRHGGAVGAAAGLHGQSAAVQDGDRVLSGLPPDRPARGLASERPADPDDRRLPTTGHGRAPAASLAKRTGFRFIEYDNAYHGFDAPNSRVRVREGLGRPKDGKAHVGTDQAARAASIKEVMAILREAFRTP